MGLLWAHLTSAESRDIEFLVDGNDGIVVEKEIDEESQREFD